MQTDVRVIFVLSDQRQVCTSVYKGLWSFHFLSTNMYEDHCQDVKLQSTSWLQFQALIFLLLHFLMKNFFFIIQKWQNS